MAKKKQEAEENNLQQMPEQEPAADNFDLSKRQSAATPDVSNFKGLWQQRTGLDTSSVAGSADMTGATNGFDVLTEKIGKEEIKKATEILQKYKEGKTHLEQRITENEKWYKLRHWECMRDKNSEVQPSSGWLFNCIISRHADAMDSFPEPNILPREESDKDEAKKLTSIVPVVLDMCEFEQTYSDVWNYKLKSGTGVYGVFWDPTRLNGLGDIQISKVDLLNLFWEPGITDIQKSKNMFHVELMDNEGLIEAYPQLEGKLGSATMDVAKYAFDDSVDTSEKSMVVDWYYRRNVNGRKVLHYCKYVNDVVLFATENEEQYANGWYEHGEYPFVFDVLFATEGTPTGYSYIDIAKDAQAYIDRVNQAIMQSTMVNARPRFFINESGAVNEEEYADTTKTFIHVDGNLGQDSIIPVQHTGLDSIYMNVLTNKIEELKEITGNRDVTNGGTSGGVTTASGIAAQQESSGKLARDSCKSAYRAYRKIILQVIELIRQFYDLPRQFRILGENGAQEFTQYSNAGIRPQLQEGMFGMDAGYRLPLFDIEVSAQKASVYSKLAQNDLALQFYQLGFFNPQNADQSLACLEMMDFDRKSFIMQRISQNGTMMQMIQALQQQLLMLGQVADEARGTNDITNSLMAQMGMAQPGGPQQTTEEPSEKSKGESSSALGGNDPHKGEASIVQKAREQAANRTSPT